MPLPACMPPTSVGGVAFEKEALMRLDNKVALITGAGSGAGRLATCGSERQGRQRRPRAKNLSSHARQRVEHTR